jgi:uncharacterized repeat protein (TIGR01451 family)
VNDAWVFGPMSDPDDGDASSSSSLAVGTADLSITKTTSADGAETGDLVSYTITVTNHGPDTAVDVVVTDDLPAGLAFESVTPSVGSCNAADPVVCSLGDLADGASATVVVNARVVATGGSVVNSASVTADTGDDDGSNDTSSAPPVPVGVAEAIPAVPTLSEWALLAMAMLLCAVAAARIRF